MRDSLRLSWSEAVSGTELYDGEEVETFATDWHFHEGWQVVAITKGERHYQFRGGSVIARPGEVLVLPPRLVHRARCLERRKTSFKIATFPAVCLDGVAPSVAMSQSSPKLFNAFVSVFRMLTSAESVDTKATILPRLQEILSGGTLASGSERPELPDFILQMESYLLQTLNQIPSLDLLSSLAGLSRYHFAHTFTKYVGLSPLAFHSRARLMHARVLISQGYSLADTSLSLSFADQSHFGRQFKRVYGMTPGDYQHSVCSRS